MTVTVYASASSRISSVYFEAASQLGKLLAEHAIICVNGGGIRGLMAAVSDAVMKNGGQVCGVIPQFMFDNGWGHPSLQEVIITKDMHGRKKTMADRSDACVALPGGLGTLEELLEIITWRQLGLYTKPVVILNIAGYFDPLIEMFEKAERENFMHSGLFLPPPKGDKSEARNPKPQTYFVATTPDEALEIILNHWRHE